MLLVCNLTPKRTAFKSRLASPDGSKAVRSNPAMDTLTVHDSKNGSIF